MVHCSGSGSLLCLIPVRLTAAALFPVQQQLAADLALHGSGDFLEHYQAYLTQLVSTLDL